MYGKRWKRTMNFYKFRHLVRTIWVRSHKRRTKTGKVITIQRHRRSIYRYY